MAVSLLRNTRLWVSTVESGFTDTNTQEILIGDDLSFSQGASETDVTVEEAGPTPTRGSKRFIDAINPAEWSFSNYILPVAGTVAPNNIFSPVGHSTKYAEPVTSFPDIPTQLTFIFLSVFLPNKAVLFSVFLFLLKIRIFRIIESRSADELKEKF